ncbi:MAG: hypothetical protein L0H99_10065 [Loigolactobacillus coryniformis]|uniref:hypothetical protein n=1 Tax=Loigolactobacillus coryniformis TaxID=1610 RepID=UPI002649A7A1|nr:hypothetical protein [Loigolactobacillus coryniformis]MDN5950946.1 hypothetical protein [Loigolactobacillus coryniformis]MDN5954237.1 hypothetical protein [Loigolactobacillus coryniformis]
MSNETKQAYALIKVSDLMDYFLNRANQMPDELSAQFVSDISFGMMMVFNQEETLRVPSKGVIYR